MIATRSSAAVLAAVGFLGVVPPAVAADTGGLQVVATVDVGGTPRTPLVDPSQPRLYVPQGDAGSVVVVDTSTRAVVASVDVNPAAEGVDDLVLDSARSRLFALSGDTVTAVDTGSLAVRARIQLGRGDHMMVLDEARGRLFTLNIESEVVRTIDTSTLRVVRSAQAPRNAMSMTLGSKKGWLYFDGWDRAGGVITIVDARTWRTVGRIRGVDVGGGEMTVDAGSGRLYASIIDDEDPGTLTVIDTRARRVVADVTVGMWPGQPVLDAPRNRVFLATENERYLYVIDAQGRDVAHIRTGGYTGRPVLAPSRGILLALSQTSDDDALVMVDLISLRLTGRLPLPEGVSGLAVDDASGVAYVTDREAGSVLVVALPTG